MKRDIYAHITTVILVLAFGFSVFLIYSDNMVPFSTQATVKTTSVEVVPEVKGYIKQLYVHEGENVSEGTPLFQLESKIYEIEKQKYNAIFLQSKSNLAKATHDLDRISFLSQHSSVSKEKLESIQTDKAVASAVYLSAQADLNMATLTLNRTLVKAKEAGIVTNLSFTKGMYASPSTAVIHLVKNDKKWIEVDFTEKGLDILSHSPIVNIVYDAIPNKVFKGKVVSINSAINSGLSSKSQLASVTSETRWIRAQQKIRVRIRPEMLPKSIVAGSRATVMVRDNYYLSDTWMTLLSWLRVIY